MGFAFKYKNVQETQEIIPGDVNSDGKVSISDIVYLITYLFKGGAEPVPPCKANVNGDTKVSVGDVVYLINYLFKEGPPPVPVMNIADANCNKRVSIADTVFLVNYLFKGGSAPSLCYTDCSQP